METKRSLEIKQELRMLESTLSFLTSAISLLMAEANLVDNEIERYMKRLQLLQSEIADLRAELKDTI